MLNAGAWDHIRILTSPHVERESSILELRLLKEPRRITLLEVDLTTFNRLGILVPFLPMYICDASQRSVEVPQRVWISRGNTPWGV